MRQIASSFYCVLAFVMMVQVVVAKPRAPFSISISADTQPSANQPLTLTVAVKAFTEMERVTVEAMGMEDYELLQGELDWQGAIKAGGSTSFSFTIQVPKSGVVRIAAVARVVEEGSRFIVRDIYDSQPVEN